MSGFEPRVRKARWWGWIATTGLEWTGRYPPREAWLWRPTREGAVARARRVHARFVARVERSSRWEEP